MCEGGNHRDHGPGCNRQISDFTSSIPIDVQRQLLKYTKEDIVDFIRALPRTLHASSSFQVDMCFQTVSTSFCLGAGPYVVRKFSSTLSLCLLPFQETMLCFSVKGVFKEGECL